LSGTVTLCFDGAGVSPQGPSQVNSLSFHLVQKTPVTSVEIWVKDGKVKYQLEEKEIDNKSGVIKRMRHSKIDEKKVARINLTLY